MDLKEFLRTIPDLQDLGEQELTALDKAMKVEQYPDGHRFIQEGEEADEVYLIVEGVVRVTSEPQGEDGLKVDKEMGPGEIFGLIGLIDHKKRSATCTAVGPVLAGSLPSTAFAMLFNISDPLAYHFQHLVARQLVHDARDMNEIIRDAIRDIDRGHYDYKESSDS
jgi:CRP-like cAMP-binding protein